MLNGQHGRPDPWTACGVLYEILDLVGVAVVMPAIVIMVVTMVVAAFVSRIQRLVVAVQAALMLGGALFGLQGGVLDAELLLQSAGNFIDGHIARITARHHQMA